MANASLRQLYATASSGKTRNPSLYRSDRFGHPIHPIYLRIRSCEPCNYIRSFRLALLCHINILRRAKSLSDYLVVVLSTDEFNWNEKQKKCYFSYEQRKQLLESIRYVDLVIPETNWEQTRTDVHDYHIDTFVMDDDWVGKFDFLKEEGVEVVYLPRPPEISTTQIKNDLK